MPIGIYTRTKEHSKKIGDANRGKKRSKETKRRISEAKKGQMPWNKGKEYPAMRGNTYASGKRPPLSEEWKRKISESNKGKKRTEEMNKRNSEIRKGKKASEKTRKKMSEALKGEKGSNWQGGITPENQRIRHSIELRLWRESVFARDNWTCQKCEERGGKLVAHHILNFATYLELRFAIDNGITLCRECHRKFHKKYGVKNNTKEQLNEFLT